MTIQNLCTRCGVTKKAVAYAVAQGLLIPAIQENGYRDFTEDDAQTMTRIATLRALGLSTEDIRAALASPDWTALCHARSVALAAMQEKQRILETLAADGNWQTARTALARLEQCSPITERLKLAFPGAFGTFLAAHFAPYLSEPMDTDEQRAAWTEAIAWLDSVEFTVPDDLAQVYAEMAAAATPDTVRKIDANLEAALQDAAAYVQTHAEEIARWQAVKESPEYRHSDAARMEQHLREFLAQSGYNDVFLPILRRLSPRYDAHQRRLTAANSAFLAAISKKT